MTNEGVASGNRAAQDRPEMRAELKGWHMPGLDFPLIRLVLIAKAMDRLNQRSLAEQASMTMAEWRVLSRLAPGSGATVREIAELAWADRAEVSRAASGLERRGLLARRDNPRDGRAPLLYCTEQGLAEYDRVRPLRAAHYNWMAGDLDPTERAEFDRLLTKLMLRIASVSETDPAPRPNAGRTGLVKPVSGQVAIGLMPPDRSEP